MRGFVLPANTLQPDHPYMGLVSRMGCDDGPVCVRRLRFIAIVLEQRVQWKTCNAGFSDRTISMSATVSPRARNKFPARTLSRSSKSSKFGPRTPSPGTSSTKMNHHPSSLDCWTRNGYRRNSAMALIPSTVSRSSFNFPFPQAPRYGRLDMNRCGCEVFTCCDLRLLNQGIVHFGVANLQQSKKFNRTVRKDE
jgi:hypothetical protein